MTAPDWYSPALDSEITSHAHAGWSVVSRTPTMVVMSSGTEPNHVLHALLAIFTVGLWAPIWILVAATSKVRRITLVANADGTVSRIDREPQRPAPVPAGPPSFWLSGRGVAIITTVAALAAAAVMAAAVYLTTPVT